MWHGYLYPTPPSGATHAQTLGENLQLVNFGPQTKSYRCGCNRPTQLDVFWQTIFWPLGGCCPLKFYTPYNPLNCISSRTCGAGWPQVGVCPILIVLFFVTQNSMSTRWHGFWKNNPLAITSYSEGWIYLWLTDLIIHAPAFPLPCPCTLFNDVGV